MISLDLFDFSSMSELEKDITKYVNENVRHIIRVLIDYLEDDNGFTSEDFLPYNNLRIADNVWVEKVYDLYDIVRSDVIRERIQPIYEFVLYSILLWWELGNDSSYELIILKLDDELVQKIKYRYDTDEGNNYVLDAITTFAEYYYILFADHDFLPESLERLVTMYLRNPRYYEKLFGDVDLLDYRILMPKDLQERFDKASEKNIRCKQVTEVTLLGDIMFCCDRILSSRLSKDKSEDDINDTIRDLLTAAGYDLRDQTRQGVSPGEKQAGEIDIMIRYNNLPYSIVEALKLSSLAKDYLSEHIDKIYNYDTVGCNANFIISYVSAKGFSNFWENYLEYTQTYTYPHKLQQYISNPYRQRAELRCSLAILERHGIPTKLYHIAVHIPQ